MFSMPYAKCRFYLTLYIFLAEMASRTPSTRETVYHTRQISRMLQNKGKQTNLGSIGDDNIPIIGE